MNTTDQGYTWIGAKAYRSWNRGEKCIEITPASFEGVLVWSVLWFQRAGARKWLVFNREHSFESVKKEIESSVFAVELNDLEAAP